MRQVSGLTLFYEPDERPAAELIADACRESVQVLEQYWGVAAPADCRVYVMTSWVRFLFHAAPLPWRLYVGLTLPLRYAGASRLWRYAGGWTVGFGGRQAVAVKPPRLLQAGDSSLGERIFVAEPSLQEKVRQITCHELTHAFTAHLRLPTWLHEGAAMVAVDELAGHPTIRADSIAFLARASAHSSGRQSLDVQDPDAVAYLYVRGYWLTRFLEVTRPGLLKELLAQRYPKGQLEDRIAAAYDMTPDTFWTRIDGMAATHFKPE